MQLFGDQIGTGAKFHTTRQAADLKHVNTCAESGTNADRPSTSLCWIPALWRRMAFELGGGRNECMTASSILRDDNPYTTFGGHESKGQLQESTEEHLHYT